MNKLRGEYRPNDDLSEGLNYFNLIFDGDVGKEHEFMVKLGKSLTEDVMEYFQNEQYLNLETVKTVSWQEIYKISEENHSCVNGICKVSLKYLDQIILY